MAIQVLVPPAIFAQKVVLERAIFCCFCLDLRNNQTIVRQIRDDVVLLVLASPSQSVINIVIIVIKIVINKVFFNLANFFFQHFLAFV